MIASSTVAYNVINIATSGLFIPLMVSIIGVAWLTGLAIKSMKSKDLV